MLFRKAALLSCLFASAKAECEKTEYLPAVRNLHTGKELCNTHRDISLYVDGCELHYNNQYGGCHQELAETWGYDCRLFMQNDGNIVFYDENMSSAWKTRTRGDNAQLYLHPDGDLNMLVPVVRLVDGDSNNSYDDYESSADAEVNSMVQRRTEERGSSRESSRGDNNRGSRDRRNCIGSELRRGKELYKGEYICEDGEDGAYFGIDHDGRLVASSCGDGCFVEFPAFTNEFVSNPKLRLHSGGNLAFYNSNNGKKLWETGSEGKDSKLIFHDDGTGLSVYIEIPIITEDCEDVQNS